MGKNKEKEEKRKKDMQHKFSCSTWIGRSSKKEEEVAKGQWWGPTTEALTTSKAQQRGATATGR